MKKQNTRRALLMSALSILLCVSMLVGTTFAWFTDEVKSGKNQIVAGNLDIELEYKKVVNGVATDWAPVAGKADIFDPNALWEPGRVEVVYLKVSNLGTLALKYQLGVNVYNEITGLTEDDKVIKLSDHLVFKVVEMPDALTTYTDREAVKLAAGTEKGLKDYNGQTTALDPKSDDPLVNDEDYLALIVYMPETVGNEANYRGTAVPTIELGINLFATQYTQEEDSWGKDYDAMSAVSTIAEAEALMAEDKSVTLAGCNEPNGVLTVPFGYTGTLTLVNCNLAAVKEGEPVTTFAVAATAEAKPINIVILGDVVVKNPAGSAITGTILNIAGSGRLTAVGNGDGAFGIGGLTTEAITVKGITIDYVAGGHAYGVGTDTKYYKDAPEGGAAIGSGLNGATITLDKVEITKAIGGSKAAGIGARYHVGVTVNITNSVIDYVEGGVSAAAIGGSRVSSGATENGTTINITGSTINAVGGAYGAGIGSGYDTHCLDKQPMCEINIADSKITAKGGRYAAGVGTGYHNAALSGEIKNSTINAESGEKFYKDTYTQAMDIGFGVVDPAREGKQVDSKIIYNGTEIRIPGSTVSTAEELTAALAAGKSVVLLDNITLTNEIVVDEAVNIHLNNKVLFVNALKLTNGGSIVNGTITSTAHTNMMPTLSVSGGTLVMEDVTVNGNHHLNANANWSEATAVEVANATAVFENCNIKISNPTKAKWVFSYGIGVVNGNVTVNGGSITAECIAGTAANGPTNPNAISTIGACTVTLNNVTVNADYYATTVRGHLTLNTTDTSVTSANIVDNSGGSHTINYIN